LPIKADPQNFAMILVKERKEGDPSLWASMEQRGKRAKVLFGNLPDS
jgi:hypothetical protein